EADAGEVDAEAVKGLHAEGIVLDRVVVVFAPVGELTVEGFEGREVELFDEKLVEDAAEEAFDLSLGGGVADGGMAQQAADAGTQKGDLLAAVDGAVVHEELLGEAAFVEGGADGLHQGVDVLLEEELAVAEDAAGIVDKSDDLSLFALSAAGVHVGPEQGVGLPQLVGVFHAEGETFLVVVVIGSEQVVVANEAVEGGLGDAVGLEQALLDTEAIEGAFIGTLLVEVGFGGVEGFEQLLGRDLAGLALVLACVLCHAGNAVVFVAVVPGLDGAPGEGTWIAVVVDEGHGGDVVHAFVARPSRDGVDGAEDAHLQIDRRLFHEASPGWRTVVGVDRLKHRRAWPADDSLRCWRFSAAGIVPAARKCAGNGVTRDRESSRGTAAS